MADVDVRLEAFIDDQTRPGAADVEKSLNRIDRSTKQINTNAGAALASFARLRGQILLVAGALAGVAAAGQRIVNTFRANLASRGGANADLIRGDASAKRLGDELRRTADLLGPAVAAFRANFLQALSDLVKVLNDGKAFLDKPRETTGGLSLSTLFGIGARAALPGNLASPLLQQQIRENIGRDLDPNFKTESEKQAEGEQRRLEGIRAQIEADSKRAELLALEIRRLEADADRFSDVAIRQRAEQQQQELKFLQESIKARKEQLEQGEKAISSTRAYAEAIEAAQSAEAAALRTRQANELVERDVNDEIERGTRLREDAAQQIAELADLESTGAITQTEAIERQRKAIERYGEEISRVLMSLRGLRAEATDPELIGRIEEAIDRFAQKLDEVPRTIERIGDALRTNLQSPFEELFRGAFSNIRNLQQVISGFANAVGQVFIDLAARIAATRVLNVIFGAVGNAFPGGPLGGFLRTPLETPATGFNSGGLVPGSGPDRDSIPAVLTPGEFVINRRAVERIGVGPLAALNRLGSTGPRMPELPGHFNAGGNVASAVSDSRPGVSVVAPTERALERMLAGGGRELIEALRMNSTAARAALGIG